MKIFIKSNEKVNAGAVDKKVNETVLDEKKLI